MLTQTTKQEEDHATNTSTCCGLAMRYQLCCNGRNHIEHGCLQRLSRPRRAIDGATFNPSLGTLTGVDLAIAGSYNPNIFFTGFHQGTIPTESQLDYSIFGLSGSFGTYNLNSTTTRRGTTLSGPAEDFAIKVDPTDVQDYVSLGNNDFPRTFGYINLYSVAANGNWGGDFSDYSLYSGQTTITYTYTPVSEPSTLAVSGVGLLLLASIRVRRLY